MYINDLADIIKYTESDTVARTLEANIETTLKQLTVPSSGRYLINFNIGSEEQSNMLLASVTNDTLSANYTKIQALTTNGCMANGSLITTLTAGHVIKLRGYSTTALTLNNVYLDIVKFK